MHHTPGKPNATTQANHLIDQAKDLIADAASRNVSSIVPTSIIPECLSHQLNIDPQTTLDLFNQLQAIGLVAFWASIVCPNPDCEETHPLNVINANQVSLAVASLVSQQCWCCGEELPTCASDADIRIRYLIQPNQLRTSNRSLDAPSPIGAPGGNARQSFFNEVVDCTACLTQGSIS